jgi:hypothetical protein
MERAIGFPNLPSRDAFEASGVSVKFLGFGSPRGLPNSLIVNEKEWSALVGDFRTFLLYPEALGTPAQG